MKIIGSTEYIADFNYYMRVLVDVFVPDDSIWIMPPSYEFDPETGLYQEIIKVLTSPKNAEYAKKVADQHNVIVDTPLMRALSENSK